MRSKMMGFNFLTYFILFSVGFFGGFRYLKELITPYLTGFFFNAEEVIYIIIFIYFLIVFFPIWNDGLKNIKKIDMNEILTVQCVTGILGVIVMVMFKGLIKNGSTTIFDGSGVVNKILIVTVLAPIIEELYCRSAVFFILKNYIKVSDGICLLISSLIFALLHYKTLLEGNAYFVICYFLIYLFLGIGCSYLYLKTGNIISPIILHIIWNVYTIGGYLVEYYFD